MSGGVDSAVALLRAGREAIGVTLRLWLDPDGPNAERACCSPEAVIAGARDVPRARAPARHARPARGVPLERSSAPFVRGYARGETPNPCIRCNGGFRFAELLAFAARAGCDRLATGHYARIVEHRGRRLLARGADPQKDQSYMLAQLDPAELERIWFPLGEQDKAETRAEAERAGLAAAQRAESQEACFLAGDDYRTFLARHGSTPRPGAIVDENGVTAGQARRLLAVHAGSAQGTRRRGRAAALRARCRSARRTPCVVGPREALAQTHVAASGPPVRRRRPCRGEAALPLAGGAAQRPRHGRRLRARARRAGVRRRARAGRGALRGRRRRRLRPRLVRPATTKIGRHARRRVHVGRPLATRPRRLPARRRALLRLSPHTPGRNRWAPFFVHTRNGGGGPAGDQQGRRQRGSRQRPARQGRSDHGQRRRCSRQRRHGRPRA